MIFGYYINWINKRQAKGELQSDSGFIIKAKLGLEFRVVRVILCSQAYALKHQKVFLSYNFLLNPSILPVITEYH